MPYKNEEIMKVETLIAEGAIFNGDLGGGVFRKTPRQFILQDQRNNFYNGIYKDVVNYFSNNGIQWWGGKKPTAHPLSSQIACINHLFPLVKDSQAIKTIANTLLEKNPGELAFEEAVEIHDGNGMYVDFEVVSDKDHLNEGDPQRGRNCTSIDAVILAKGNDNKTYMLAIEWKYTEQYSNKNLFQGASGKKRRSRYINSGLIKNSKQLSDKNSLVCYSTEPFYQFMRQTLWAEEMIKHKKVESIQADDYFHILVVPEANKPLLDKKYTVAGGRNMVDSWKSMLKTPNKCIWISPEDLFSNLSGKKYDAHLSYLKKRYW